MRLAGMILMAVLISMIARSDRLQISANGNVLNIAVDFGAQDDLGAQLVDISTTVWNSSSSNVPGSSGGISFGASTGPWFPAIGFRGTGQVTINFGASSFSGGVPSGFTAYNSLA